MSRLANLVPEVLLNILDYLPQQDIYSLLRTCKSLYPICYRFLWSIMVFQRDGGPWYANRGMNVAKVCNRHFKAIRENRNTMGFEHTRVLWLGQELFEQASELWSIKSLGRNLIWLLANNILDLREVIVFFSGDAVYNSRMEWGYEDRDALEILLALNKYSESKSIRDFSVKVQADAIWSFSTYFQPELVTHLELQLRIEWFRSRSGTDIEQLTFEYSEGPIENDIAEFTDLFHKLVNLETFIWKPNFRDSYRTVPALGTTESEKLADLQVAFSKLGRLRKMVLIGYLFHPYFFLAPPENVKKFTFATGMQKTWWLQFAKCALERVEELSIVDSFEIGVPFAKGNYDEHYVFSRQSRDDFVLGDVACRGLKKLEISSAGLVPSDLEDCLVRNNPCLDKETFKGLAESSARPVAARNRYALNLTTKRCREMLSERVPPKLLDSSRAENLDLQADVAEDFSRLFVAQDAYQLFVEKRDNKVDHFRKSQNRWANFSTKQRKKLREDLDKCMEMVVDQYAYKFQNPNDVDSEDFVRDCWQSLGNMERVHEWLSRKEQVQQFVEDCETRMSEKIDGKYKVMLGDLADRHLAGETTDQSSYIHDWAVQIAGEFEQDTKSNLVNQHQRNRTFRGGAN
ncbi:hypothetical protein TWF281_006682 [Arthrobotrys megalospora]